MKIISYIDPEIISAILYFLYVMISLATLMTLLIYLPLYLKKDQKERKNNRNKLNYIEKTYQQIELAAKSKYYRANLAQILAKGFAFKSGYSFLSFSNIIQLLKDDKIDIPQRIKSFLLESAEFYNTFLDNKIDDLPALKIKKILNNLKNKVNKEKIIEEAIELLYKKFNE
ncbi:MAG: hypothetical protein ACK4YF_01945 [Exilispira sp.]